MAVCPVDCELSSALPHEGPHDVFVIASLVPHAQGGSGVVATTAVDATERGTRGGGWAVIVVGRAVFSMSGRGVSIATNGTVRAAGAANAKVVALFVAVATLLSIGLVDPGTNPAVFTPDDDWTIDEFGER